MEFPNYFSVDCCQCICRSGFHNCKIFHTLIQVIVNFHAMYVYIAALCVYSTYVEVVGVYVNTYKYIIMLCNVYTSLAN